MSKFSSFLEGAVFRGYEHYFQWRHGLLRSQANFGSLVKMEIAYHKGPEVELSDGFVIGRGYKIGIIHLDNKFVASFFQSYRGKPEHITLPLRREFVSSLKKIAHALSDDQRCWGIAALRGETILWRETKRLGFDVWPIENRLARYLAGLNAQAIINRSRPGECQRSRELKREVMEIWMSRYRLLSRYH